MSDSATTFTRDELVTMVARAHGGAAYAESTAAGRALADQSRLPRKVAENLGAGFGQWDFFPEPAEIVDWALGYVAPETPEDLWALARRWSAEDAEGKPTVLVLVGLDLLKHELRRIDVPELRALADETRAAGILARRKELGLAVPAAAGDAPEKAPAAPKRPRAAPKRTAPEVDPTVIRKMPRPEFKKPVAAAPPPPPKRYTHPKFGEGVLEARSGEGPEAKLTIMFASGKKTLQAQFVTELPDPDAPA